MNQSMLEFSDRERKIITIMLTVINPLPEVRSQDEGTKIQLIREALRVKGILFNEPELAGLVDMITKETRLTSQNLFGFLQRKKIDWKSIDFGSILKGK